MSFLPRFEQRLGPLDFGVVLAPHQQAGSSFVENGDHFAVKL